MLGIEHSSTWILSITAGGFIYIATTTVLPTLLENSSFAQTMKEVSAMSVGVALMVAVTMIE